MYQKNKEIAELFSKFADILEFKGDNVFKINAYRKASRVTAESSQDIELLYQQKRLGQLSGIGKTLQEKIGEYLQTGKILSLEKLLDEIPADLFELLAIPGYGPKTAALAYNELNVETLKDLERVLEDGSFENLPGMGAKKVENLINSINFIKTASGRFSIATALLLAETVIAHMKKLPALQKARMLPAGSVRRFRETVHDVDILVESEQGKEVIGHFLTMPDITRTIAAGETKASVLVQDRYQVDLRVIAMKHFGAALQYFTGSQSHNVRVRELARKKGLKISEYGVFAQEHRIAGSTETELYKALDMPYIAPELREDRGEIEAALQHRLPRLIQMDDIKGDLHIHSTYSDGKLSLQEMVSHLIGFGYQYAAFCDHSKSAFYANGLTEDRLLQQQEEITRLNEENDRITVLSGCEVDILPDGTLDFDDAVLEKLDFVVASIHSAFKSAPTDRIIKAMNNPFVDVIGHPTGRLISRRESYDIDINKIVAAAAETGTALEVNSFWDRLDLCDIHIKPAIENGVKIAINTDSHHYQHLEMIQLGVGTARRGWCEQKDVINTWDLKTLRNWQKRR